MRVYGSIQKALRYPRKTVVMPSKQASKKVLKELFMQKMQKRKMLAAVLVSLVCAGWGSQAVAATAEAKALYQSANQQAAAKYKTARAQCDGITGNPKDVCIAEAKAVRAYDEARAQAQYTNTLRAYTRARVKIADANYDVDLARCGALTGNDRMCASSWPSPPRLQPWPTPRQTRRLSKRAAMRVKQKEKPSTRSQQKNAMHWPAQPRMTVSRLQKPSLATERYPARSHHTGIRSSL